MTSRGRRLAAMRANPKNVRFDELAALLSDFGFEQSRGAGSHVLFKNRTTGARYCIPDSGHGRVKPCYVRRAVKMMEALVDDNDERD